MPSKLAAPLIDRMFRAVSDRTRLRIMALLLEGELCVCDIVSALDVPQPTASRHLAYLRKSGLVVARKKGQWNYYRLAPAERSFHEKLLDCVGCCVKELPDAVRDLKRLQAARRTNDCC